jgi:hypothetical protein
MFHNHNHDHDHDHDVQEVPEIRDDEKQKTSTVFLAASKAITHTGWACYEQDFRGSRGK